MAAIAFRVYLKGISKIGVHSMLLCMLLAEMSLLLILYYIILTLTNDGDHPPPRLGEQVNKGTSEQGNK